MIHFKQILAAVFVSQICFACAPQATEPLTTPDSQRLDNELLQLNDAPRELILSLLRDWRSHKDNQAFKESFSPLKQAYLSETIPEIVASIVLLRSDGAGVPASNLMLIESDQYEPYAYEIQVLPLYGTLENIIHAEEGVCRIVNYRLAG